MKHETRKDLENYGCILIILALLVWGMYSYTRHFDSEFKKHYEAKQESFKKPIKR